jgi:hypothetical protein
MSDTLLQRWFTSEEHRAAGAAYAVAAHAAYATAVDVDATFADYAAAMHAAYEAYAAVRDKWIAEHKEDSDA